MSQSLVQIYLHVVFSTKDRKRFLAEQELRNRLHAYLFGCCRNQKSPSLIIGGVEEHVHILCRLSKSVSVAALIRELKRESSKWIKTQAKDLCGFSWQQGYGAFSISPSHVEPLKRYSAGQEQHHRRETFQDEFRRLCHQYGVPIDERYVWD
jgi:REP element-mobilizing transposase RayT